jgi:hypothetical protein
MCFMIPDFYRNSIIPHGKKLAGMAGRAVRRVGGGSGSLFEVEERMAGKFRDAGVGVAEEREEKTEPAEFVVFDADEGGTGHGEASIFSSAEDWNSAIR